MELITMSLRQYMINCQRRYGLTYKEIASSFVANFIIVCLVMQACMVQPKDLFTTESVSQTKNVETVIVIEAEVEDIQQVKDTTVIMQETSKVEEKRISTMEEMAIQDRMSEQLQEIKELIQELKKCEFSIFALEKQQVIQTSIQAIRNEISDYPALFSDIRTELEVLQQVLDEQAPRMEALVEEDVYNTACVIQCEVGSIQVLCHLSDEDTLLAKQYTGSAFLNRLKHKEFKASTTWAALSGGAYDSYTRGWIQNCVPTEEHLAIARDLIENGTKGPDTLVFQAEFEQGSGEYIHIGNQSFCTLEKARKG